MKDRFERLYEMSGDLYVSQAPVIVTGGVLLKDTVSDSVIIQLKFQSISEKVIKALKIRISALDVTNQILPDSIEYQYLDLNIRTGQEFGSSKAIVVPSIVTRSFNIDKVTVIFEDSQQWESESELSVVSKIQSLESTLKNKELVKQYRLTTNKKAICIPTETMGIWRCSCSTWNNKEVCSSCGLDKECVFSAYDLNSLTEAMDIRIAKEEEEARKEREFQEARNKKRRKRNIIIIVIFAIVILGFGLQSFIRENKQDDMVKSLDEVGGYEAWVESEYASTIRTDVIVTLPVAEIEEDKYTAKIGASTGEVIYIREKEDVLLKRWIWLINANPDVEGGDTATFEMTLTLDAYAGGTTPIFIVEDIERK